MTQNFDAIVIGAGVMGASIAFHLAGRGLKTVILERNVTASGATPPRGWHAPPTPPGGNCRVRGRSGPGTTNSGSERRGGSASNTGGPIVLTGVSLGTGSGADGVRLAGASSIQTSASGNITVTGSSGASGNGLRLSGSSGINALGTGNVLLAGTGSGGKARPRPGGFTDRKTRRQANVHGTGQWNNPNGPPRATKKSTRGEAGAPPPGGVGPAHKGQWRGPWRLPGCSQRTSATPRRTAPALP